MKRLLVLALCLALSFGLTGCAEFRPSWIREDSYTVSETEITEGDFDGPRRGHFDDEGNWIPDEPTIAWTYKIPDISAGFVFDIASLDATPSLQIELLEFDIPFLPYLRTWKFDAGVAYQRAYLYGGPLITSIFEISLGGFVGWNFEDRILSYGVGFTIIKF
jgi:hypothetical protein